MLFDRLRAQPSVGAVLPHISTIALTIVPAALLVLALLLTNLVDGFLADPNYQYLFNGLNVLYLHAPRQDSHPGTPVALLSAVIIGLVWLIRVLQTGLSPDKDVLLHPDTYLSWINFTFVAAGAIAIFILGLRLHKATQSLGVAVVAQISFLLSAPLLVSGLTYADPETLLISLTALLAILQVPLIFNRAPDAESYGRATLIGVVIGACIATKVTAVPLLLTILFLRKWRGQFVAVLASMAGAIVFTLPIIDRYPAMAGWFWAVLTHAGAYGTGAEGLPAAAKLWETAQIIFTSQMGLCFFLYAGLWLSGAAKQRGERIDLNRLFMVCSLVLLAQMLMITKHPGRNYFVPAVAVTALGNAGVAYLIISLRRWARWLGTIVATVVIATYLNRAVNEAWLTQTRLNKEMQTIAAFLSKYTNGNCRLVYYFDAWPPEFKLFFGNLSAGSIYGHVLAELFPQALFHDGGHFQTFAGALDAAAAARLFHDAKCIYMIGSALERFGGGFGFPAEKMTLVDRLAPNDPSTIAVYKYNP